MSACAVNFTTRWENSVALADKLKSGNYFGQVSMAENISEVPEKFSNDVDIIAAVCRGIRILPVKHRLEADATKTRSDNKCRFACLADRLLCITN